MTQELADNVKRLREIDPQTINHLIELVHDMQCANGLANWFMARFRANSLLTALGE